MEGERVLLFGRTGAGKSTLGNMLYAGHPSPPGGFIVGDGLEGVTSKVDIRNGPNGWTVVDTIGMGEAQGGTVSTGEAEKQLVQFLRQLKGTYKYLIYVFRKGRMDDAQSVTWEMFKKMFVGGESNFVVVFTGADETWLDKEMIAIKKAFSGCDRFCAVDLPAVVEGDPEMERMYEIRRNQSIRALQQKLEGFGLQPVVPKISKMTEMELLAHAKVIFFDLCTVLASRFANAIDNPMRWILDKIFGPVL